MSDNPTPPSAGTDDELRKEIRGVLVNLVHDAFNASATEKAFTLGDDELNRIMEDIDRYTKEAVERAFDSFADSIDPNDKWGVKAALISDLKAYKENYLAAAEQKRGV